MLPNQDFGASLLRSPAMRVSGRSTKIRKSWSAQRDLEWLPTCIGMVRGRIPNDDLHESLSEGEGACSRICDGRSHLPLRGKLGWMTPRPGQKRAGKRNASLGLSFPSEGPFYFPVLSCWDPSTARPVKQDSEKVVRFVGRAFRHDKNALRSSGVLTSDVLNTHISATA